MRPPVDPVRNPVLYRSISKKKYYRNNEINKEAFIVEGTHKDLSTILDKTGCSITVCIAGLNTCFGEFHLNTIRVLDLGLRVLLDDPADSEYSENHASIILPKRDPNDIESIRLAEDFASLLRDIVKETGITLRE
jgi:hypothetical protein